MDELARLRPDLEQFLVLTSLKIRQPTPAPDNRFLEQDWTPARALGRVIDAGEVDLSDVPRV